MATKKAPAKAAKKTTVKKTAVKDMKVPPRKSEDVKGGGKPDPTWNKSCYC